MAARRDGRRDAGVQDSVVHLHETFERLRQRHLRLGRMVHGKQALAEQLREQSHGRVTIAVARERVGYHSAWSRWSQSYDELAAVADRLVRSRPGSLAELLMVYRALEWVLLTDAVVVDRGAELQVRIFGRLLRQFAAGRT